MIPSIIVSIIILSMILIKGADMVIVAIRRISKTTHTGLFALSALILAIGTSFPELFVGITSAIEGSPEVSLGDVTGSNIANIALVGGFAALLVGKVRVSNAYLKRDVFIALIAGVLPLILLGDHILSRVDGLILLTAYFAYATSFFRRRYQQIGKEQQELSFIYRFLRKFNDIAFQRRKEFGRLFIGFALLLFSADSIVRLATYLANLANIPNFVIGVVVIAIGTSIPEFVFSLKSLKEHEPSMFFGNLLGSTIANSTLVLGVVSLIHPIKIIAINHYMIAVVTFIVVFFSFWYFIRSKHRLDRWEASVLLLLYLAFLVAEFS